MKKTCNQCGKSYKSKRKDNIYCSKKCGLKAWEIKNKSKRKEIQKRRYYKNPRKALKYTQDWKAKNKEYYKNYNNIYYSNIENKTMALIRRLTWNKYGSAKICSICNSTNKAEHHHFKPYNIDNFIDLCKKCHIELFHKK